MQPNATPVKNPHAAHPSAGQPFVEVAEELVLAGAIIVGHGLLVLVIIGTIWVTNWALTNSVHGHEPEVAGVTARYLIEGGEIILIGIVLTLGIISAFVTLIFGLWRRLWR